MADHHPPHIPKKRTMVKDRVGCPKTSTYDLPEGEFTYGKPRVIDPENAGEIVSHWVVATPSQVTKSKYMTVYQNILAIKNGCITAKSMREFGKDHPTIHLKEALSEGTSRTSANHEGPFGRVTAQSDVSMQELIQANFTNYVGDDNDYPDVSAIEDRVAFPRPRATLASTLQRELREKAKQEEEPKHFTMKKFQNIQATFNTQPSSPMKTSSLVNSLSKSPSKSPNKYGSSPGRSPFKDTFNEST